MMGRSLAGRQEHVVKGDIMPLAFDRSVELIARASRHLPGGVSSNFRLGMAPTPLVFDRADGPYLWDVDGNRLIDYYLGMGPMILGHRPQALVEAVTRQMERGILYGGQSELEFEAAELVCAMVPSAERVRFGSSGTEVIQAALRLARAATGRSVIVKFEGHYHGWLDNVLWSVAPPTDRMGEEGAPHPLPGTGGQDMPAGAHVEVLSWNRPKDVEERLSRGDVAAVIMEAAMCNTGAIRPLPGYLEAVREACTRTGTVLIFDEVITGFRVGPGGVQGLTGITPDLAVFGKAIANGFPVAALTGKAALMDEIGAGRVMHGGTYNAQAVAMAATVATLKELRQPGFYERVGELGGRLMTGIAQSLAGAGIPATVTGFPQIFHVGMGLTQDPVNYRDIARVDRPRYVRLTTALLRGGVRALERGAWFPSICHDEAVIDETLSVFREAVRTI